MTTDTCPLPVHAAPGRHLICRRQLYHYAPVLALLGIALLRSPEAHAQLRPSGIGVSVDYVPASRYIRPEDSVKTHSKSNMRRINFEANLLLSNKIDTATKSHRAWAMTLNGSYASMTNTAYEKPIFPRELLTADIGVQHLRSLRNNWSLFTMVSLGISTDLTEINGNDIFFAAGAFFVKQKRKFTYGFGAVASNVAGVPLLLPGVLFQYQTQGKWRVNVVLPQEISLTYLASEKMDVVAYFRPKQVPMDVDTKLHDKRMLIYWELPVGLEGKWHLGKVDITAGGGLMALRSFQYSDKSISKLFSNIPAHRLAANYFLNAGVRWNF